MGLWGSVKSSRKWLSEALRQANRIIGVEEKTVRSQSKRLYEVTSTLAEANDLISTLEDENKRLTTENASLKESTLKKERERLDLLEALESLNQRLKLLDGDDEASPC